MMALKYADPVEQAYPFPLLIRHLLANSRDSAGSNEIVYGDIRRLTYPEFLERTERLAEALTRIDVGHGTVVAVLDWDSHRYLEAFFAIPMLGAVLQMVNVRLSRDQILYTLRHSGAEILLVHSDFVDLIDGMRSELADVRIVIGLRDDADHPWPDRCDGEYEALLAEGVGAFAFEDFDENALATTYYTTGTTGTPKAVCFSHRQIVMHTLSVATMLGLQPSGYGLTRNDVYLPLTPMFHAHGWGLPFIATMLGLKQVYPGRFDAAGALKLIRREGATFSHGVPTILQMILKEIERDDVMLPGFKIGIGGSVLTPALQQASAQRQISTFTIYGMSESAPFLAASRPISRDTAAADVCHAGYAPPLLSLRIDRAAEAPENAPGEVLVRAPWLTACYRGQPDASADLWQDGWLHTQDVGCVERGLLTIGDRLKDIIKTGGEWVSSLELEALLLKHPAVREVAVVGIEDGRWGERPVAAIVPAGQTLPELQSLRDHLEPYIKAGAISRFALPDRAYHLDFLPRTSVGKIDKKELRRRFGDGSQEAGKP